MPDGTWSVAELVDGVRAAVAARFAEPVWVQGEIAGLKRARNGHVWFDLLERDDAGAVVATLPVVLWSSIRVGVNAQLKRAGSIRMDDGVRIRIAGPVEVFVTRGRLQLQMQAIDPTFTLGLLASERDRVLRALESDGLLGRNRSLALPAVPHRVGLVTAAHSAAEADVLRVLRDSGLAWEVVVVDARVQGAGSERAVAAALLAAAGAGVDLVALVRGGGARTDLATFDHELVARTIAGLEVPVLTGIGHEIDSTVADVVAHDAHTTPTACARAVVEMARSATDRAERAWLAVEERARRTVADEAVRLAGRAERGVRAVRARTALEAQRTDAAAERLCRGAPSVLARQGASVERATGRAEGAVRAHLRVHDASLSMLAGRVPPSAGRALRRASAAVDRHEAHVGVLDPERALARGWSITRSAAGTVVRRRGDVEPGDLLLTTVAGGTITSTVVPEPEPESEERPDAR